MLPEQCPGGVAQLGERVNGIHEVRGSIPLASTWSDAVSTWRRRSRRPVAPPTLVLPAGIAQLVEHNLAKVGVAGSSPVSRLLNPDVRHLVPIGVSRSPRAFRRFNREPSASAR